MIEKDVEKAQFAEQLELLKINPAWVKLMQTLKDELQEDREAYFRTEGTDQDNFLRIRHHEEMINKIEDKIANTSTKKKGEGDARS